MNDMSLAPVPAASAAPASAIPAHPVPDTVRRSRGVERLVRGQPTSDGAGVKLTRVLTQPLQRRLDPFLMLDAFGSDSASDYIGGFPDHPHRGFETVTIMKAGRMRHRDSVGNVGLLEAGSVQWMTAGRGIIHSEMPEQEEGRMAGFQLWVNLAARDKMQAPAYRDVPPGDVPRFTTPAGVAVRVVAGRAHGVGGAVTRPVTEPLVLDLELPPGSSIDIAIPPSHNAFAYSYGAPVLLGDEASGITQVEAERMAILAAAGRAGTGELADGLRVTAPGDTDGPARVLLVAGQPLNEPIVQYGPFVMNTTDELHQAVRDYQAGVLAR
jgi:redox-sensitive bicupin YhaK (pirin superfamily)